MLPSSGYFQSVTCPFFKSGLCERPHCHFKHAKTDLGGKTQWNAVEDVEIVNESETKTDLFSVLNRVEPNLDVAGIKSQVLPAYVQVPTDVYVTKPSGILKVPAIKQEKTFPIVPEYKPTPISQLKQLNQDVKPLHDKFSTYEAGGTRKRKKFEEYDPEEVKYSRKRVSFNLPDEDGMNDNVITIDSSDEDIDTDSAAKFSDDNSDEDEVQVWSTSETKLKPESEVNVEMTIEIEEPQKEISEFSLVDKILVDVSRNEQMLKSFNKPFKVTGTLNVDKTENKTISKASKPMELNNSTESKPSKEKDNVSLESLKDKPIIIKAEKNIVSDEDIHKEKIEKNAKESAKKKVLDEKAIEDKSKSSLEEKDKSIKPDKRNVIEEKGKSSTDKKVRSSKDKSKSEISEIKDTKSRDQKERGAKDDKAKSSKEEKSRSIKEEKGKSSKDETVRNLKEEKAKGTKEEKGKSSKQEKVSKSSKEDKIKSKDEKPKEYKEKTKHVGKDEKIKYSSKDSQSKSSKEGQSKTSKSEKVSSKDHAKIDLKKPKPSSETKSKSSKEKTVNEKSKSSSSGKQSTEENKHRDNKSIKSKSKDSLPTTKVKSSHKSSSSKKTSSTHSDEKSILKNKELKKIQDEKISSSSVYKKDKSVDHKYSAGKQSVSQKSSTPKETDLFSKDMMDVSQNNSDDDDGMDVHSDVGDIDLDSSGSELDSDTYEECWRIFNETNVPNTEETKLREESPEPKKDSSDNLIVSGKKRLAHQTELKRTVKSSSLREKQKLNPAQIMHNRYLQLQEMYAKQNEKNDSNSFLSSINKNNPDGTKKRIALAPSSSLVAAVAQKNKILALSGSTSTTPHTVVTTIKGVQRVAHVPTTAMSPRPLIPAVYGSKVATNIRQRYLNNFIDECLKFCVTEDQAYDMALDEEKRAYERSTNKTIYLNVAANTLNRLRHRAREGPPAELPEDGFVRPTVTSTTPLPDTASNKTVSHETMLAGPRAQKFSYSIERRKNKPPELVMKGAFLYNCLHEYLLNEEQLVENGFPVANPDEPGGVIISGIYANKQSVSSDPFRRICCRCKKSYYVDEDGNYIKSEECDFHWGRIYKRRIAGSIEARYMCCQGDSESDGCCVGPGHVFEGSDSHVLKGFVKTLPKTPPPDRYYGVFSLDCEMCYTTAGIELTRVTVIGPEMNTVFETFVKPEHKVLDYNTRFSGITEEDLVGVTTTIRDVQAILLCMFNDKTILIGHSLESDFKALKLIHKTVVDTSVVFPHKMGLPYKRALRTLMAEKCNKIIQNSIGGHDSQEDAAACMELMLWKIKEDIKFTNR